jgi:hypothetical protein
VTSRNGSVASARPPSIETMIIARQKKRRNPNGLAIIGIPIAPMVAR